MIYSSYTNMKIFKKKSQASLKEVLTSYNIVFETKAWANSLIFPKDSILPFVDKIKLLS